MNGGRCVNPSWCGWPAVSIQESDEFCLELFRAEPGGRLHRLEFAEMRLPNIPPLSRLNLVQASHEGPGAVDRAVVQEHHRGGMWLLLSKGLDDSWQTQTLVVERHDQCVCGIVLAPPRLRTTHWSVERNLRAYSRASRYVSCTSFLHCSSVAR